MISISILLSTYAYINLTLLLFWKEKIWVIPSLQENFYLIDVNWIDALIVSQRSPFGLVCEVLLKLIKGNVYFSGDGSSEKKI